MKDVLNVLQWISASGYALLGIAAVAAGLRYRDRGRAYLALALGLLGWVSIMGQVQTLSGKNFPLVLTYVDSFAFMGCGYALLLFRHHVLPLRRVLVVGLGVLAAATTVWVLTLKPTKTPTPYEWIVVMAYFLTWCGLVTEPAFRLWRVSRTRPAVQRARLRALSTGYLAIVAVLVVAIGVVLGGNGRAADPTFSVVITLMVICAIPLLYISFAPPRWLRRSWRAREEDGYRTAMHDLMLYSPDRATLAQRAADWASRLVGGEGAAIVDSDGSVLASHDIDERQLLTVQSTAVPDTDEGRPVTSAAANLVMIPMPLERGAGKLAVVASAFSPVFGGEEIDRLREYATSVTAALDRVELLERVQKREEELREANSELEQRVDERTHQLQFANRELTMANRELEAFSYSVSHDLRAPLRAVNGFTRILTDEHADTMNEEARRYLGLVADGAEHMGRLVDALLTFSRLSRQPLNIERISVHDVAQKAAARILMAESERKVELEITDLPDCDSDPVLLEQVFTNLLSNALKFTRGRDVVHIEVGWEEGTGPHEWQHVYYVRDNGVGFDMRYADKLFRVFERLHRADEFEGEGAGLAIVARIIARHDGDVWAEGKVGAGATFYFTLGSRRLAAAPPSAAY